jgi:hypothetical protein
VLLLENMWVETDTLQETIELHRYRTL